MIYLVETYDFTGDGGSWAIDSFAFTTLSAATETLVASARRMSKIHQNEFQDKLLLTEQTNQNGLNTFLIQSPSGEWLCEGWIRELPLREASKVDYYEGTVAVFPVEGGV